MSPATKPSTSNTSFFTIVILLALLMASGYWGYTQHGELAGLRVTAAQAEKDKANRDDLVRENRRLKDQISQLENQAVVSTLPASAEPTAGRAVGRAAAQPNIMNLAAQMMNTPAMRNLMEQTARRTIETRFAGLFDQLGLTGADRAKFVDLLVAQQMGNQDLAMKMMSSDVSAEERRNIAQQMKDSKEGDNAKIRDLIGDNGLAAYTEYNRTQAARTQATQLNQAFVQAGEPLSGDQASALQNLMTEERRNFKFTADMEAPDADPLSVLNGPLMDTYIQEQGRLQEQIAQRASGVLSPTQLETFRKTQSQQLQTIKAGMELTRQMTGGRGAGK